MSDNVSDNMQPAVSIIVPCYNAAKYFHETLDAIFAQEWDQPWEVVIADNRSTDHSREIAEDYAKRYPNLRLVPANDGQGTTWAVNAGVAAARGRSVLLCDSDDVPSPGWLAAMGDALAEKEFVACRMDVTSLNPVEDFGSRPHPQTDRLMKISYPPYLYHAGGSTLGIRRELFLEVGGYDPKFIYLHETDFCFRMQLAGHTLSFVREAVQNVRFRRDNRATFYQSMHWGEYNVLLFRKYRGTGEPAHGRWKRLLHDGVHVVRLMSQWRRFSPGQRMSAMWLSGWLIGKLKGMILYRSAPY